jgi:hypothetical protein
VQVSFAVEDHLPSGRLIGIDQVRAVDFVPVIELAGEMHRDPAVAGGIFQRRNDRSARRGPDIGSLWIGIGEVDVGVASLFLGRLGPAGGGRRQHQECECQRSLHRDFPGFEFEDCRIIAHDILQSPNAPAAAHWSKPVDIRFKTMRGI